MSENEFQETKTLTFEWRLRDLKSVFEARYVLVALQEAHDRS